ncbi:MAG: BMC domain-containing protein [Eubacteriales bacterium]|nr:BMC domain-containing protein [Eubacteriales bacterium]
MADTRVRITRDEFLQYIFSQRKDELRGDKYRLTRVRVPGCEVFLAHLIGTSDQAVYRNLGLHIGVHLGEDHTGDSLGLLQFTPWESVVVASDIALKAADVSIGFMDRFNGSLILTGERENVKTAIKEVLNFFGNTLKFEVCELTEN